MRNYSKIIVRAFGLFLLMLTYFASNVYAYSPPTHRIAGPTRYETAASIAKEGWPNGSNYVVLAYGENFPDALVATPLATSYDAPILLTGSQSLTPTTKDTLTSLGTKSVFIVGGTGVVSPEVENQLQDMGISVTRLAGNDRYDTSVAIANQISNSDKLIATTGIDFPDALSISSFAGERKIPIVLVDSINDSLNEYLTTHNIQQTYVIGNKISDSVMSALPNASRIQGNDKYDTNLTVLKTFEPYYNFNNVFIATGNNFADALAGSAYAAKIGSPLILVDSAKDNRIANYLALKNTQIKQLNILGGEGALSSPLIDSYLTLPAYLPSEIAKIVSPSVVYIETYDQSGNGIASGSGFVVDANGKIATNYHVIKGAYSAKVKTFDGDIYDITKVLSYDNAQDMALVKIEANGLSSVALGDSDMVNTGDKIYAIGNPLGLYDNTISDGLISSKSRQVDGKNFIQISAPISPGSSGGVLVNEQGIAIGITTAVSSSAVAQNINFAIPINLLKPMLTQDIGKTLAEINPQVIPTSPTQTDHNFFPELSDVPMPIGFDYNYMEYSNDGTLVYYKYYYSYISSTSSFILDYFSLLTDYGWKYHKQETVSGALMTSFVKGNYLIGVVVMSDGIEIIGKIH